MLPGFDSRRMHFSLTIWLMFPLPAVTAFGNRPFHDGGIPASIGRIDKRRAECDGGTEVTLRDLQQHRHPRIAAVKSFRISARNRARTVICEYDVGVPHDIIIE